MRTGTIPNAAHRPGNTSECTWAHSPCRNRRRGTRCRSTENTTIRMMPNQNEGIPRPISENSRTPWSAGPSWLCRGEGRQRRYDDSEEGRDEHEGGRQLEARGDERGYRALVLDRGAEIAVREAVEVPPELAPDRLVQAELMTKSCYGRRRRVKAQRVRAGSPGISRKSRNVTTTTPSTTGIDRRTRRTT